MGSLSSWYAGEHRSIQNVPFEDRALGEVLEEFYTGAAARAHELRSSFDELGPEEQRQLQALEDVLSEEGAERHSLVDLTPEQSEDVWLTAHKTGDPLCDKWEREIARGEVPDLEEELSDA